MSIGSQLRKRRLALGLSQLELAQILGRTQPLISQIERDHRKSLNSKTLAKLADALKTTTDYLLERTP